MTSRQRQIAFETDLVANHASKTGIVRGAGKLLETSLGQLVIMRTKSARGARSSEKWQAIIMACKLVD
jgi:hypothetical protein